MCGVKVKQPSEGGLLLSQTTCTDRESLPYLAKVLFLATLSSQCFTDAIITILLLNIQHLQFFGTLRIKRPSYF